MLRAQQPDVILYRLHYMRISKHMWGGRGGKKEGERESAMRTTPRPIKERGMNYVEQTVRSEIVVSSLDAG